MTFEEAEMAFYFGLACFVPLGSRASLYDPRQKSIFCL